MQPKNHLVKLHGRDEILFCVEAHQSWECSLAWICTLSQKVQKEVVCACKYPQHIWVPNRNYDILKVVAYATCSSGGCALPFQLGSHSGCPGKVLPLALHWSSDCWVSGVNVYLWHLWGGLEMFMCNWSMSLVSSLDCLLLAWDNFYSFLVVGMSYLATMPGMDDWLKVVSIKFTLNIFLLPLYAYLQSLPTWKVLESMKVHILICFLLLFTSQVCETWEVGLWCRACEINAHFISKMLHVFLDLHGKGPSKASLMTSAQQYIEIVSDQSTIWKHAVGWVHA